jgi:hypothetical protein
VRKKWGVTAVSGHPRAVTGCYRFFAAFFFVAAFFAVFFAILPPRVKVTHITPPRSSVTTGGLSDSPSYKM